MPAHLPRGRWRPGAIAGGRGEPLETGAGTLLAVLMILRQMLPDCVTPGLHHRQLAAAARELRGQKHFKKSSCQRATKSCVVLHQSTIQACGRALADELIPEHPAGGLRRLGRQQRRLLGRLGRCSAGAGHPRRGSSDISVDIY